MSGGRYKPSIVVGDFYGHSAAQEAFSPEKWDQGRHPYREQNKRPAMLGRTQMRREAGNYPVPCG
jgi:hypothetical protein